MAQKSYFTHSGESTPGRSTKTAEHVHMLNRVADSLHSDYEGEAKAIRSIASRLAGGKGTEGVKEKINRPDKKGAPRD